LGGAVAGSLVPNFGQTEGMEAFGLEFKLVAGPDIAERQPQIPRLRSGGQTAFVVLGG
jgi:hypothetical protein